MKQKSFSIGKQNIFNHFADYRTGLKQYFLSLFYAQLYSSFARRYKLTCSNAI